MNKKTLYKLDFEEAAQEMINNGYTVTTYDTLKEFAIEQINDDKIFVAIHILEAIQDTAAQFFNYDFSMGTLDTPTAIETLEDLENLL